MSDKSYEQLYCDLVAQLQAYFDTIDIYRQEGATAICITSPDGPITTRLRKMVDRERT